MDSLVNTAVQIVPERSSLSLPGSITITKTTIVVFKNSSLMSNAASPMSMVSERSDQIHCREGDNEEPLFLGVCSIPLIQFHRDDDNVLTLSRGNALLFDNAATSTSLQSNRYFYEDILEQEEEEEEEEEENDDAGDINKGKFKVHKTKEPSLISLALGSPAEWRKVTLVFNSVAECDGVVSVLLRRHAEELYNPPFPATYSETSSQATGMSIHTNHAVLPQLHEQTNNSSKVMSTSSIEVPYVERVMVPSSNGIPTSHSTSVLLQSSTSATNTISNNSSSKRRMMPSTPGSIQSQSEPQETRTSRCNSNSMTSTSYTTNTNTTTIASSEPQLHHMARQYESVSASRSSPSHAMNTPHSTSSSSMPMSSPYEHPTHQTTNNNDKKIINGGSSAGLDAADDDDNHDESSKRSRGTSRSGSSRKKKIKVIRRRSMSSKGSHSHHHDDNEEDNHSTHSSRVSSQPVSHRHHSSHHSSHSSRSSTPKTKSLASKSSQHHYPYEEEEEQQEDNKSVNGGIDDNNNKLNTHRSTSSHKSSQHGSPSSSSSKSSSISHKSRLSSQDRHPAPVRIMSSNPSAIESYHSQKSEVILSPKHHDETAVMEEVIKPTRSNFTRSSASVHTVQTSHNGLHSPAYDGDDIRCIESNHMNGIQHTNEVVSISSSQNPEIRSNSHRGSNKKSTQLQHEYVSATHSRASSASTSSYSAASSSSLISSHVHVGVDKNSSKRSASSLSSRKRKVPPPVDPIEREFRVMEQKIDANTKQQLQTPNYAKSSAHSSIPAEVSSVEKMQYHEEYENREEELQSCTSTTLSSPSNSSSEHHYNKKRTEVECLVRSMLKLHHHRLHFMEYLHKEMIHQAYLAEEAKILSTQHNDHNDGVRMMKSGNNSHRRSATPYSTTTSITSSSVKRQVNQSLSSVNGTQDKYIPSELSAATSSMATNTNQLPSNTLTNTSREEVIRLKEIEARLAEVEALHHAAEQDRNEVAQLKKEWEYKLEELNVGTHGPVLTDQAMRPTSFSHENKDEIINSAIRSPRHWSVNNVNAPPAAPITSSSSSSAAAANNNNNNNMMGMIVSSENENNHLIVPLNDLRQSAFVNHAMNVASSILPTDADLATSIMDRYIYGDKWHLLYPEQQEEIRTNAQMDFCLALSLPRKLVHVLHLAVDQPGLRVTLEVRHDLNKFGRDTIERRVYNAPCRFLKRLYDLRHALHEIYSTSTTDDENQEREISHSDSSRINRKPINEAIQDGARPSTPFLSSKSPNVNATPSSLSSSTKLARKLIVDKYDGKQPSVTHEPNLHGRYSHTRSVHSNTSEANTNAYTSAHNNKSTPHNRKHSAPQYYFDKMNNHGASSASSLHDDNAENDDVDVDVDVVEVHNNNLDYNESEVEYAQLAAEELSRQRHKLMKDVQHEFNTFFSQLMDDEDYHRESLLLREAKHRQTIQLRKVQSLWPTPTTNIGGGGANSISSFSMAQESVSSVMLASAKSKEENSRRSSLSHPTHNNTINHTHNATHGESISYKLTLHVEGSEAVARAGLELGAARQMQLIMSVHRHHFALLTLCHDEEERRVRINETESRRREELCYAMQPRLRAMLKAYHENNKKQNNSLSLSHKDNNNALQPFQRYESKAEMDSAADAREFAEHLQDVMEEEHLHRRQCESEEVNEWINLYYECKADYAMCLRHRYHARHNNKNNKTKKNRLSSQPSTSSSTLPSHLLRGNDNNKSMEQYQRGGMAQNEPEEQYANEDDEEYEDEDEEEYEKYAMLFDALIEGEAKERNSLMHEAARRHFLYAVEKLQIEQIWGRDNMERKEAIARNDLFEQSMMDYRELFTRHVRAKDELQSFLRAEHFYRTNIMSDEQDGFEICLELFASKLKAMIARMHLDHINAAAAAEANRNKLDHDNEYDDEDDLNQLRRRKSLSKETKTFHYITFEPSDMDHAESAKLALEGMLGCDINKNLEVVSIVKPLPLTSEPALQFQAADMILDVAGFSLHSLSHLKEVLAARAVQIQDEVREHFPFHSDDELTTKTDVQNYIATLCEHHNFLVQVLRGCDIVQVVVRS